MLIQPAPVEELNKVPAFVVEVPRPDQANNVKENQPVPWKLVDAARLTAYAGHVYIIHPSHRHAYRIKTLKFVCHYHLDHTLWDDLKKTIHKVNDKHNLKIEITEISWQTDTYHDCFVSVRNNVPQEIIDHVNFCLIREKLECGKYLKYDPLRKHSFVDLGYTGYHCSTRKELTKGVSCPNWHSATHDKWAKQLLLRLTEAIPMLFGSHIFHQIGLTIYSNPERNKIFAEDIIPGNRIESARVCQGFVGGPHIDSHNCAKMSDVIGISTLNVIEGSLKRLAVVTYDKEDVASSFTKVKLYAPLIAEIKSFYNTLPKAEKQVSAGMLLPSHATKPTRIGNPHVQKQLFYSNYRNAIEQVFTAYPTLRKDEVVLAAFLTAVPFDAGCQDYFVQATADLCRTGNLSTKNTHILNSSPLDIAIHLRDSIEDLKQKPSTELPYVPKRRYQPNQVQRTDEHVKHSITTLQKWFHILWGSQQDFLNKDVKHYYEKLTGLFCMPHKEGGIHGAGPLTSQHLLAVASMCEYFPPVFLTHAEMPESTTWHTLVQKRHFKHDKYSTQSKDIMEAIAWTLDLPMIAVEEVLCRFCQHIKQSTGRYTDSIYPGFDFVHLRADRKQHVYELVRLTKDGTESLARPILDPSIMRKLLATAASYNLALLDQQKIPGKALTGKKQKGNRGQYISCYSLFP